MKVSRHFSILASLFFVLAVCFGASAQEKVRLSHSALETSNAVWFIAQELGFYKKHGLDSELLFIPSTTTSLTSLLAGDVHVANVSGGAVASAVLAGAQIAMVACYLNSLPYEMVVHESIKSAEELKGKSIGISRLGSASDVAARALLRGLNLEPDKQVPIMQVGGSSERAAAFRAGRIAGFPSPPGVIHLTKGMPHRILISTADFKQRFEFPYICAATTKAYLQKNRETVKKVVSAHIEAVHFVKTRKDESKKIMAKYARTNNEDYLEAAYTASAKLYDVVPLVTRPGVDVQIKEATSRKPGAQLRFEDMVDESIVKELDKSGFIDKVYKR
ncbi:MAG TPA: ABC transporter substrate-binding protein [Candidatus Limnocylindria bacterium]|nr:ABC transporter substrate-binding protein [Candidatus Limnocylindria bacterium]